MLRFSSISSRDTIRPYGVLCRTRKADTCPRYKNRGNVFACKGCLDRSINDLGTKQLLGLPSAAPASPLLSA